MFKPVWTKIYQFGFMGGLVGDAGCWRGECVCWGKETVFCSCFLLYNSVLFGKSLKLFLVSNTYYVLGVTV